VSPIFDRTKETLCSSDTGIAMTRRMLLEALGSYRDHGTKPKGVTEPDVFMVRAVSLRLPPEDAWADAGAEFMRARLGADFGYDV
jgi:phthalate 4,5-dioxygenase oxygenase subunit